MATGDPILSALTQMEERLVERMEGRFRDLRVDLDGHFDAVLQRLNRLEQEYEMLKAGVARLEADITGLKADVAGLKADVATLKADIAALKKDVAELKGTVGRLEARAERDRAERADLHDQALEWRRRLDALEERVRELEERLPPD